MSWPAQRCRAGCRGATHPRTRQHSGPLPRSAAHPSGPATEPQPVAASLPCICHLVRLVDPCAVSRADLEHLLHDPLPQRLRSLLLLQSGLVDRARRRHQHSALCAIVHAILGRRVLRRVQQGRLKQWEAAAAATVTGEWPALSGGHALAAGQCASGAQTANALPSRHSPRTL